MNNVLTPDQIADLAGVSQICEELGAELVVIGATSLLILMGDLEELSWSDPRFRKGLRGTVMHCDFVRCVNHLSTTGEFDQSAPQFPLIGWVVERKHPVRNRVQSRRVGTNIRSGSEASYSRRYRT